MANAILKTSPHNLVHTQNPDRNISILNNNTIKQIPENKIAHGLGRKNNQSNKNANILSKKPSKYCNDKCTRCGRDVCFCKCL